MDKESHYALVSQQLEKFTTKLQRQLLEYSNSYRTIFERPAGDYPEQLWPLIENLQDQYQQQGWRDRIDSIEQRIEKADASIIPITSTDYPPLLKQIVGAPALLYVRGNRENLHLPQIAVVGSRRMTRGGETNAFEWSKFLAAGGFVITSGLAQGVDGVAHAGALAAMGKTIGVMGTGIDTIYPREHRRLAENIIDQGGTLISEFDPGTPPLPTHFPSRNRIISGLSLGVLVVEAAPRSGSLITARLALEQNREVFAIPGSIHNPQSRGCHQIIKQGAHLVERAEDIIHELQGALAGLAVLPEQSMPLAPSPLPPTEEKNLLADELKLLSVLGFEPVNMDSLAIDGLFSTAELSRLLVSLELKGLIENNSGFYQRLS
ncbi:MAG: DNA-processing protein DprA [Porticoccaceae bacterium]|nr:DNA-processing protein DprA [Porticoccaceae bacterium]